MRRGLILRPGLGVLAILIMLVGCTPAAGETPAAVSAGDGDSIVVAQPAADGVFAEGVVEPARSVTLRAAAAGRVTHAPVPEGSVVSAGDLLVEVDATPAILAVQRAEAGLAQAEAQLAAARAGVRDEQLAILAAQVSVADAAVAQAAAQRDAVTAGLAQADALAAQAGLLEARLTHEAADEAHDDTMTCYNVPTGDGGEREICPTLGTLEEMARAQMEAAYAGILAAQAQLDQVEAGATPEAATAQAGVSAAAARRDAAEAELALAQAGARQEEIAVAEAGAAQALASLAQARERLVLYTTDAPFAGVLTDLPVSPGDTVTEGAPVATLATLDDLQIRTTDLTELDVAQLAVGDVVVVVLDAVPGEALSGTVARIDPQGTPLFGDVIYEAVVTLDRVPDWVRWGMTAQVTTGTTAIGTEAPAERVVIVEGVAAPVRSSELQFTVGGQVADVLVEVGDVIRAGDHIARLDDGNQRSAVAAAEAAVASARAELALTRTGARAEEIAAAQADLAAAEAGLWQAVAARDQVTTGVAEAEAAATRAQLQAARAQRRQLEAALLWAEGDDDDERVADVRKQINAIDVAITGLEARLTALPVAADARLRGGNAGVSAAVAQVEVAEGALNLLLAGPTEERIAVAAAAVAQAEAGLAEARDALNRALLTAPFDGTVTRVTIEVGETVSPGRPVVVLADLAQLQVETTDLTELDVVAVQENAPVEVTVDALPGQTWSGYVREIKRQSALVGGDVTYPTIIELEQPISGLRWGMTVAATIGR